jgi:vacuolar-type H+-ATPase subunit I/STV1
MKKVTIITPPEYEGMVLEALGKARVTQLKPVTGNEFKDFTELSRGATYFDKIYNKIKSRIFDSVGLNENNVERVTPNIDELKSFSNNPEELIENIIKESSQFIEEIKEKEEKFHMLNDQFLKRLQDRNVEDKQEYEQKREDLLNQLKKIEEEKLHLRETEIEIQARLESVQALEPKELKNCFAVGIIQNNTIPEISEYLDRKEDIYYKKTSLSENESLIFVFGSEESEKWVDFLFLIFDVKDIFQVLDPRDVLLVLDPEKRQGAIEKYRKQLKELEESEKESGKISTGELEIQEKINELRKEYDRGLDALKKEYEIKIEENKKIFQRELKNFENEQKLTLGRAKFYLNLLNILRRKNAPVLRGKVISVIQGYTPENKLHPLRIAISKVEEQVGEQLYLEISDLDTEDHHAPTPEPNIQPKIFQPTWILTRLRGWPSAEEINPAYISVLVFSFQFGLMFGDIGQGLLFLVIGLALRSRFERGMMKYLTTLFIPMGISAIIFGFMYDSIFLLEGQITHWIAHTFHISEHSIHHLSDHHIVIDLGAITYPIMPSPILEMGKLMNLIFMVGAVEIVFGAILGAFNAYKEGNYVGMLGEHGIGMGLYVTGLYLSAGEMFTEGLNILLLVSNWPFKLMIGGMLLSFLEPVLHSVQHGHGVSIESMGEGLGGLLMTFVEGLANMFSFLRIAAFALAHASLAGAGITLGNAIGSKILGSLLMNLIALSFEFVSSSVQSLRLLYYEFMGKFYHGVGVPYRPFRINE